MDRRQKAIKCQHNELSLYSHTTGHEHWWKPTSQFMYKISQLQQFVVSYPFFPMYSIKFPWHSTSLTRAINKYYNLWPIKNRQISLHTRNASIGSPFVYTYSDRSDNVVNMVSWLSSKLLLCVNSFSFFPWSHAEWLFHTNF